MSNINVPDTIPFPKLSRPAHAALKEAGYTHLGQLANVRTKDLLALHGFGPKSIPTLREALAAHGLTFADERSTT
jgi:DNA-directed RNA polymerase alpha subunit